MWISKKKYKALVKRVADLEVQVQSQQKITAPEKTTQVQQKEVKIKPGMSIILN